MKFACETEEGSMSRIIQEVSCQRQTIHIRSTGKP